MYVPHVQRMQVLADGKKVLPANQTVHEHQPVFGLSDQQTAAVAELHCDLVCPTALLRRADVSSLAAGSAEGRIKYLPFLCTEGYPWAGACSDGHGNLQALQLNCGRAAQAEWLGTGPSPTVRVVTSLWYATPA